MATELNGSIDDLFRMQRIAASHGWLCDLKELEVIWQKHSTDYDAGWLYLDEKDDTVWEIIIDNLKCQYED